MVSMQNFDDFDDPETSGVFKKIFSALGRGGRVRERHPGVATGVLVVLGLVLGSVLWYSYPREKAAHELRVTPIVRADAGDFRVAPKDPGGMDVPYQDSTVFGVLAQAGAPEAGAVETLLPPSEQAMPRDRIFPALEPEEKNAAAQEPPAEQPAYMAALTDEDQSGGTATASSAEAVAAAAVEPAAEEKAAEQASKTEPAAGIETVETKDSVKILKDGVYIQLGSLRSRESAEAEWKKMQSAFPAQLGDLTLRVEEADLGDRGKFYRMQGGPVASAKVAAGICQAISSKKPGGCLVVRP